MKYFKTYAIAVPFEPDNRYMNAITERYRIKCNCDNKVLNSNCVAANYLERIFDYQILLEYAYEK